MNINGYENSQQIVVMVVVVGRRRVQSENLERAAIFGYVYNKRPFQPEPPSLAIIQKMPHEHHHGCGHESHDHDHDHDSPELGFQDNLFTHIDRQNVIALNANGKGSDIIKPWHERLDETKVGLHRAMQGVRSSLGPVHRIRCR